LATKLGSLLSHQDLRRANRSPARTGSANRSSTGQNAFARFFAVLRGGTGPLLVGQTSLTLAGKAYHA